jgi:hypothetical protein
MSEKHTKLGVFSSSARPIPARISVLPVSITTTVESRKAMVMVLRMFKVGRLKNQLLTNFINISNSYDAYIPLSALMLYPSLQVPASGKEQFTDYSRWRLLVNDGGRHTWHYLKTDAECTKWPQNSVDKYWLGLPVVIP